MTHFITPGEPLATAKNLFQLLEARAAQTPEYIALTYRQTQLSYAALRNRALAAAAGLTALGVKKGDRVALLLPNTPTYAIAFFALQRIGAVVVNLSPSSQGAELSKILADCEPVAMISLDLFLPGLYKGLEQFALRQLFITSVQGLEKRLARPENAPPPRLFDELLLAGADAAPDIDISPDELAVLQYTSGSTGAPKGVMLSPRNILASVTQVALWMRHDEKPNAGVLCILPFFHVFGLTIGLHLSVALGYRMILVPRAGALDLMPLVELIETERPSSLPAVPTLWAAIVEHPGVTAETLSSIHVASSGGAPLPDWVQAKYRALTGRRIYEAYGLSEAAGATHCAPFPDGAPLGSIGRPLPGLSLRLVDSQAGCREVAAGEVGELVVRGDSVMGGYFRQPGPSRRALREGFLHTGDLMRRDEEGFFYVVDRLDDLILTSGHNVYPSEIEPLIAAHPSVKEVAVVGKPDRMRGAIVVAYIVARPGETPNIDQILRTCRQDLPDWKVPRRIVVGSLPRNPAGKTLRKNLRESEDLA